MAKIFHLTYYYNGKEAGPYKVIRMFDKDRVLVEVGDQYVQRGALAKRQLSVIPISKGRIV